LKIEVSTRVAVALAIAFTVALMCGAFLLGSWNASTLQVALGTNHARHMQLIDERLRGLESHPHPATSTEPTSGEPKVD